MAGFFYVFVPDRSHHVFTVEDPRLDGCTHEIGEGYGIELISREWPRGSERPGIFFTGRAPSGPVFFKEFRTLRELLDAGFLPHERHDGVVLLPFATWSRYLDDFPPLTEG